MQLRPQIGIDNFVFGISDYRIIRKLGTPDLIEEAWDNYDELVYHYYAIKTSFSFLISNNRKLCLIRTANPSLSFENHKIIGRNIQEVQKDVLKTNLKSWEVEPSEHTLNYYNQNLNIVLNTQYNTVKNIEIHPDLSSPFINESKLSYLKVFMC